MRTNGGYYYYYYYWTLISVYIRMAASPDWVPGNKRMPDDSNRQFSIARRNISYPAPSSKLKSHWPIAVTDASSNLSNSDCVLSMERASSTDPIITIEIFGDAGEAAVESINTNTSKSASDRIYKWWPQFWFVCVPNINIDRAVNWCVNRRFSLFRTIKLQTR